MHPDAISRLLEPYAALNSKQLEQTSSYLGLLLKWNAKVNLTGVRGTENVVARHFGESFFAARQLLPPEAETSVIDLGSGAGFPGLPLAIFAPRALVTLIEPNAKKTAFLNEVISALRLSNARVARQRGDHFAGSAELVTMRAVERFEAAVPIALDLVCHWGRLALMIGLSQTVMARTLTPKVSWSEPVQIPGSNSRVILVGTKVGKNQSG